MSWIRCSLRGCRGGTTALRDSALDYFRRQRGHCADTDFGTQNMPRGALRNVLIMCIFLRVQDLTCDLKFISRNLMILLCY